MPINQTHTMVVPNNAQPGVPQTIVIPNNAPVNSVDGTIATAYEQIAADLYEENQRLRSQLGG